VQPLPARLAVTRVAHATVLLDFDGEQVLTDPWFTEKEGYHHGEALGFSVAQLPKLTAVVASHGHYDHFDIEAFAAYPDKAVPFFVATGMADAARKAGFINVQELEPWQSAHAGSLTVTAAPGEHGVREVTYVIEGKGDTVYFGGDTKLIPALEGDLPRRFPIVDLALLSVNGLQVRGQQVVMTDAGGGQARRGAPRRRRGAHPLHVSRRSDPLVSRHRGGVRGVGKEPRAAHAGEDPGARREDGDCARRGRRGEVRG
jgi:L-ascorbate metabolism protein UlaG (beta-lactamase superfamily)